MSRFAYVNGQYVRHMDGQLSIDDRAALFADAVYEVWAISGGQLVDNDGHFARLARSQAELGFLRPVGAGQLSVIFERLVVLNKIRDGIVYVQISRGVARRDHVPPKGIRPSIVVTMSGKNWAAMDKKARKGITIKTVPDVRWVRVDIKTVALLPNCLAKMDAISDGFTDAWMVDKDGYITESTAQNAWIVTQENGQTILKTRPLGHDILAGITRARAQKIAEELQIKVVEAAFTIGEAMAAKEAFITSATSFVTPVIKINDSKIGNGESGPVALALRDGYLAYAGIMSSAIE